MIAGACVTALKACTNETFVLPDPQVAAEDGLSLVAYKGSEPLTVGGELNKLAANVDSGRNTAGVHWRSDAVEGLLLGEAFALSVLADLALTYHEAFAGGHLDALQWPAGGGGRLRTFVLSVIHWELTARPTAAYNHVDCWNAKSNEAKGTKP